MNVVYIGHPNKDPTHIDFIPNLFKWTPESVRQANKRHAEKYQQMKHMKRKGIYGTVEAQRLLNNGMESMASEELHGGASNLQISDCD